MLLDLESILTKYHIGLEGVIHCGAHYGEEKMVYDRLGIPEENQHYFEPQPHVFKVLKKNVGENVKLYDFAVGNETGKKMMNVEYANNSQSSSLAEPELHLQYYPHIQFVDQVEVEIKKLDDVFYNFELGGGNWLLSGDLQGWEYEMLKGAEKLLKHIDCIMLEINERPIYKNCPHVNELDAFLSNYEFKRVESYMVPNMGWGDGFWKR